MTNKIASVKKARLLFDWLLVVLWMAVIFAFSSQAHSGEMTEHYLGPLNIFVRKMGHITEFALLFLLIKRALANTANGATYRLVLAAILTILYAATDEYHQSFVPGRTATAYDVMVDSVGVLLAIAGLKIRHHFLLTVKSCKS